jgi:uncharacterized protein (TIGR03435 family)
VKFIRGFIPYICCGAYIFPIMLIGTVNSARAQSASTPLAFEVATIKPVIIDASHASNAAHSGVHVYSARAYYRAMTLKSLVRYAYSVKPFQVSGPASIDTEHYDIEARFPKGATEKDERKMLQALLKERFKLTFHIDKKALESYVLVVGKHGANLKASLPDPPKSDADAPLKPGESNLEKGDEHEAKMVTNKDGTITVDMGKRGTQSSKFDSENLSWHYERSKMSMTELAWQLEGCLGNVSGNNVENQTGLKGDFQVAFDCPMAGIRPSIHKDASDATASDPQGGRSLKSSLDALGLKLEKRKVPLDVYVVDHIEKPSEN